MPSSLPSVEDLADYLRVVETAVDDYDVLDGVRLYTQSLIRKVTGRTWTVASGSASTRVYAPRAVGQDLIRIHDCVTVTCLHRAEQVDARAVGQVHVEQHDVGRIALEHCQP